MSRSDSFIEQTGGLYSHGYPEGYLWGFPDVELVNLSVSLEATSEIRHIWEEPAEDRDLVELVEHKGDEAVL